MKDLMKNSIRTGKKLTVVYPMHGDEETIDMTEIGSKFNGMFSTNNSTITFVVDNEVFVTPYTKKSITTLIDVGLIKGHFYVPLSNGDYPKHDREKWRTLREEARKQHLKEYEEDCSEWCEENGIGELSDESLSRCLRIPPLGIQVKHHHYEMVYFPIANEKVLDSATAESLGTYCTNNGRLVFVYRDGHTYATRGYKLVLELKEAGFRQRNMFVPFSNGEQIMDYDFAAQWDAIGKK